MGAPASLRLLHKASWGSSWVRTLLLVLLPVLMSPHSGEGPYLISAKTLSPNKVTGSQVRTRTCLLGAAVQSPLLPASLRPGALPLVQCQPAAARDQPWGR